MAVFGVDYAWGRPGVTALKRAGAKFACRYLSHDTTGKNLTRSEADDLSDAGIWVVVVWETTAKRPLAGRSAGAADARDAAAQARACGMPGDRPIYFAADWDAAASQQDEINAYLDGAASVIGRDRVGLYAGYGPMKRAFDAGKIAYGWQTYAWSGGRWDARAQLQQYSNGHTINGVGVDYDRAVKSDYGQWRVGASPEGEDDMPSVEDIWEWDGIPSPRNASTHDSNPTWKPSSFLRENAERIRDLQVAVAANGAAINELSKALAALAADRGQEIDVDALVARITSAIESVTVRLDVPDAGTGD